MPASIRTVHPMPATAPADHGIAPPGHRLPAATHLGRVRLQVSDLSRSLTYYSAVLGLRVLQQNDSSATLGAHGSVTPLVELYERPGAAAVPRQGRLGLYHFAVLLPDRPALGRFLAHLRALGVRAGMSDHLVSEAIYLTDPDGLGIEVYADRPRSGWQARDGQLEMATNPMSVPDVLAAAAGEPWTGMPVGTTIGHVHLFVDDVERAARFYHDALGFDKMVWSYPGALFMAAGGYHHHLGTNSWAAGAPRAQPDDARLLEWEIILPTTADVDAAAASLAAAGIPVDRTPTGDALADDPWGTRLRLVAAG
jgi:catechol 2,3-dioxygenase